MLRIIKLHWPLFIALIVFCMTIAVLLSLSFRSTGGHLIYCLDDPYIHMAMAKNFVLHGTWGIHKYNFTSSSSSPLWVILLVLIYFLFGVNENAPFVLNFIFGILLLFEVYFILRKYTIRSTFHIIVLISIIFFTPLYSLIFCGQEHTMQIFFIILFVYLSTKVLLQEIGTSKEYLLLMILTPLMVFTRYESLFLVSVICLLFILKRKFLHSLGLGGAAIFLILIYGTISLLNGWYFIPNTIILKGRIPKFTLIGMFKFFYHFTRRVVRTPHIFILLFVSLFYFIFQFEKHKTLWKDSIVMLVSFIITTNLHILFAKTGSFFRYEAYLICLGFFVIAIVISEYLKEKILIKFDKDMLPKYIAIGFVLFIFISPFVERGLIALRLIPEATKNIFEQQYQMGLFLKKFYQGKSVAANDIGAINYLADIKCIDLWGLANLEVLKLKRAKRYTTQQISELTKKNNVKIAIIYEHWFREFGGIPSQWIKVGEWKILNNVICGGDTISFYAVQPSHSDILAENLRSFSRSLPENVKVFIKKTRN